eukprot:c25373_g1_i2 orf=184-2385(+)
MKQALSMLSVPRKSHAPLLISYYYVITISVILVMISPDTFCPAEGMTCGGQTPCTDGSCCSQYGFCGNTSGFCGDGCLSLCQQNSTSTSNSSSVTGSGSEAMVSSSITSEVFDLFFYEHNKAGCPAQGFYNLSSFLAAAATFPAFGTTGGSNSSKNELAAFFAYASQVVEGGCYVEAVNKSSIDCQRESPQWDCASGKKYYGRSPLQIAWNTNYGPMGVALGFDGINDPELIATNPILSFRASLWYWMTTHPSHPYSCHEAMLTQGQGFKEVVNIINGGPLDSSDFQAISKAYDAFYLILEPKPNVTSIAPAASSINTTAASTGALSSSKGKSCIGSLCSTRSKVMGLVVPLALGGMMFTILALLLWNRFHQHWLNGERAGDKTMTLQKIRDLAGTPINFSYATLASATNKFTVVLGQGGFGIVYKGVLPSGEAIAVKVLNESTHTEQQFLREIETLGKLHHVNVVRLVGFCVEKSKRILVYEFIRNNSLEKHLFHNAKVSEGMDLVLSWEKRYEIALGIARGLSYIHEECLHKIIHRDMKPHNILLDDLFCPKISDFGLAKIIKREESTVVSHLKGTPGYMAPEFWVNRLGELSTKFDVYSFGMVALELVAGRPNFKEDIPSEQSYFPEWAYTNITSPAHVIDSRIVEQADMSQVQVLILVALWCIQEDPSLRPSMSRVVQYLEGIIDVPSNPPQPFKDVTMSRSIRADGSSDCSKMPIDNVRNPILQAHTT